MSRLVILLSILAVVLSATAVGLLILERRPCPTAEAVCADATEGMGRMRAGHCVIPVEIGGEVVYVRPRLEVRRVGGEE